MDGFLGVVILVQDLVCDISAASVGEGANLLRIMEVAVRQHFEIPSSVGQFPVPDRGTIVGYDHHVMPDIGGREIIGHKYISVGDGGRIICRHCQRRKIGRKLRLCNIANRDQKPN